MNQQAFPYFDAMLRVVNLSMIWRRMGETDGTNLLTLFTVNTLRYALERVDPQRIEHLQPAQTKPVEPVFNALRYALERADPQRIEHLQPAQTKRFWILVESVF